MFTKSKDRYYYDHQETYFRNGIFILPCFLRTYIKKLVFCFFNEEKTRSNRNVCLNHKTEKDMFEYSVMKNESVSNPKK